MDSFSCRLSFFGCTLDVKLLFYTLRNILPEAILLLFTHFLSLCRVMQIVLCMYANFHCCNCEYGPVIGIFIQFKDRLPEAICCCLQNYTVSNVLLVMYNNIDCVYHLSLSL